jgi:TM2 domain-containing membrane protein YozV
MKFNLLLSFFAFLMLTSTVSYASFPVQPVAANASETTSVIQKEELTSPAVAGDKSQIVALILCGFLGTIGIHRFYLGYIWQGIVQILTLGGLGIWTLIDFVRILLGTLKPKDGEYDQTI